ncbi:MAG: hypothetical protein MJ183_09845 [Treponemataceae bacterium]|nr:hypothetical protein [Treponemataceae bacterium]
MTQSELAAFPPVKGFPFLRGLFDNAWLCHAVQDDAQRMLFDNAGLCHAVRNGVQRMLF